MKEGRRERDTKNNEYKCKEYRDRFSRGGEKKERRRGEEVENSK